MKKIAVLLPVIFCGSVFAQYTSQAKKIENIKTFAKLYGYVRYFHPSDEAAALDWEKFASYGCMQVENAQNADELVKTLNTLFLPVAPSLQLFKTGKKSSFDLKAITPPGKKGYSEIYWQHLGLGIHPEKNNVYRSVRVNRPSPLLESTSSFASVYKETDAMPYRNTEFMFKAWVKMSGEEESEGYLWAREDLEQPGARGFFDNMKNRPIVDQAWKPYVIKGRIGEKGSRLFIGAYTMGRGELMLDDVSLSFKNEKGDWEEVYSNGFENDQEQRLPADFNLGIGAGQTGKDGSFFVINTNRDEGRKCLLILSQADVKNNSKSIAKPLFEQKPGFGECIEKEIGNGISCILPLCLYGTVEHTYPASDSTQLRQLNETLKNVQVSNAGNLHNRLAATLICYTAMQHFYPYFDVVKTDWEQAFVTALTESYKTTNGFSFLKTLQKFTAQLKDGHVRVAYSKDKRRFMPPVAWEVVEGEFVITKVLAEDVQIPIGSVVTQINGQPAKEFMAESAQYISAATQGWLNHRLQVEPLVGNRNDTLVLDIAKPDGSKDKVTLSKTLAPAAYFEETQNQVHLKSIAPGIFYINLDKASMKEIEDSIPALKEAKAIICDLRGYPNSNHRFISHLLKQKDTSSAWMRIPHIIYPDYKPSAFSNEGWQLAAVKPHLDAKIIFITAGGAISYAESYMGFIENYKLATIVGQPTAGTNGNVNHLELPGGYSVTYTGMRVVRHNGTQQHGIGILPNVYVNKTIRGVVEGRDEFLEKALELAN